MRPPGVTKNWDDMLAWIQAKILSYAQIREYEEFEILKLSLMGKVDFK